VTYATAHNGGRSQSGLKISAASDVFLNVLKHGQAWSYRTDSSALTPSDLNADGYPTTITKGGPVTVFYVPLQSERPGNYVVKWTGNGTIHLGMTQTAVSGSLTSTTGSGRYEFSVTEAFFRFVVGISAIGDPIVSNLIVCHEDDEALIDAGEIFSTKYKERLAEAGIGILRLLDAQGGNAIMTTDWASNRPINYPVYGGPEIRASWYAGVTTNSGGAYSVSAPPGWAGLVDKAVIHVKYGATATPLTYTSVTITSGTETVINWTAHGLSVNDPVSIVPAGVLSRPPVPMTTSGNYYVKEVVDANSIKISATAGGAAINTNGNSGTGTFYGYRAFTLNVGGTGDVFLKRENGWPCAPGTEPTLNQVATLVYDAQLNGWMSTYLTQSRAFSNGVPPLVLLKLCAEVGAHPWWNLPVFAADPATDFMTELATMCKDFCEENNITWMKPIFEGCNECWNTSIDFVPTWYAGAMTSHYQWALPFTGFDYVQSQWYGKTLSVMGQAVSAVYGDDRTKYDVVCGVQTSISQSLSNERLSSASYVAQSAPAQSGYTKSAAYNWTTKIAVANYINPAREYELQELKDAYNYVLTNAGDAAAQAAIADDYVDTLGGEAYRFNIAACTARYALWYAWAQGNWGGNINLGMFAYEGGYSPDFNFTDWTSTVTGATQATSCVLTLATSSTPTGGGKSGNAAVVGAAIDLTSVGGMTALNCATFTPTFTNGSANISGANSLILNQAVVFTSGSNSLPTNITYGIPYYVVSAGNPFQVSATRGGTAIVASGAGSGITARPAWFITAVSGNSVTIDVNSTGFGAYTSGGTATYTATGYYTSQLRNAGKDSTRLLYQTQASYREYVRVGGEYPSEYIFVGLATGIDRTLPVGGAGVAQSIWGLYDPTIWAPTKPAAEAIALFNRRKLRAKLTTS
jgi:hypothetical protein